jgi:protein-tyrosine-phosphatase
VKVLFVCVANENRSQIAEAIFNKLARGSHATSAGLKPSLAGVLLKNERSRFVALMEDAGYDMSKAKVKRINRRMADSAGRIVFLFEKKHLGDIPTYLRNRSGTELWEVESISEEASVEEYAALEKKRIRQIETRVKELLKRLEGFHDFASERRSRLRARCKMARKLSGT